MYDLTREDEWKLISLASAVVAAIVVRSGLKATWKAARDEEPPLNPLRQDSEWTDALVFAAAMGLGAGLARLGARTAATYAWEKKT